MGMAMACWRNLAVGGICLVALVGCGDVGNNRTPLVAGSGSADGPPPSAGEDSSANGAQPQVTSTDPSGAMCPRDPMTCDGTMNGPWCIESVASATGALYVYGIWAADPSNVWVVGTASNQGAAGEPPKTTGVMHHFDGCRWREYTTYGTGLRAVWGANATDVWFAGQGSDYVHFDGASFHQVAVAPEGSLTLSVSGTGPNDVWAVGRDPVRPTIHHWDGTAWTLIEEAGTLTPGEDIVWDVWATAPTRVFASTSRGKVLELNGTTWSVKDVSTPYGLHGIWSGDGLEGWAVGQGAQVARLQAGTWTTVRPPGGSSFGLGDVGGKGSDVFAVGDEGRLLIFDGAELVQDPHASPTDHYSSVWVGDSHVWVATNDGRILRRAR